jgi:uncharacterized protein
MKSFIETKEPMVKQTKNLILFLAATFLWTYAFYAPIAIGHHNTAQMPYTILLILGGMGPSVVGVGMVLLNRNKAERRDYFQRCFSLKRIGRGWWGVIFLIFPVLTALSIALDLVFGGYLPEFALLKTLIANPVSLPLVAFISFMSGPWSEEFGWRGYALDRIISRLGTLRGTLVLGVLWGVWHLPLYFMAGTWHGEMGFRLAGFWSFVVYQVGLSLIMTCVFLRTHRSIFSAMLVHFTSNFTSQLTTPASDSYEILRSLLILAAGIAFYLVVVNQKRSAPLVDSAAVSS